MAEVYGKQGRAAYVRTRFTFDLIFPLVYTMFLGTAISWVYRKAFMPDSRWQRVNLVPVLGALFDYLENLSTSLIMLRYPNQTGVVDVLAPVFTSVKWVFISGSFVLLLGGVVVGVWQWNKRRGRYHSIGRYDRMLFSARGKTMNYEGRIPWDITPADAIAQAYAHWQAGDLLEAGLMLYERVPRRLRPAWAANILRAASEFVPQTPEIEAVLAFAECPDKWGDGARDKMGEAHNFFDSVRGLALENQGKDDLFRSVLVLAENVAKVTYNAYGYEAPFDHHPGWLIGAGFLDIVERVNDSEFTARAWSIPSNEQHITLTIPEMCNPACSFCNIWYLGSL